MPLRIDNKTVTELRGARSDGTLVKVGEARVWDGQWHVVFTSAVPAVLLRTDLLTSAGSHTITPPAGAAFFAAVLVGGGGSGGKGSTNANVGGGGGAGKITLASGALPMATSLTIGAGGPSRTVTSAGSGTAGSTTTWGTHSAAGGAAGTSSGNTDGASTTLPLSGDFLVWAAPDTQAVAGPGGSKGATSAGSPGVRGGGGGGAGRSANTGAGGVGWVKIWWWTSDPTQAPPVDPDPDPEPPVPRRVVIMSAVPGDTTWALEEPTGDTEIFVDFDDPYPDWGNYDAIFNVAVTCDHPLSDSNLTTTFPAGTVIPAGTPVNPRSDTPARTHTFTEVT